jgi:hypothetical protein
MEFHSSFEPLLTHLPTCRGFFLKIRSHHNRHIGYKSYNGIVSLRSGCESLSDGLFLPTPQD